METSFLGVDLNHLIVKSSNKRVVWLLGRYRFEKERIFFWYPAHAKMKHHVCFENRNYSVEIMWKYRDMPRHTKLMVISVGLHLFPLSFSLERLSKNTPRRKFWDVQYLDVPDRK